MGDYLIPKGRDGAMPDIRSFTHIEVATHGDETEDVKILRTPEAPMENVSLLVARVEMPASEVLSPVEIDAAECITTGAVLTRLPKMTQLALRLPSQPQSLQVIIKVF